MLIGLTTTPQRRQQCYDVEKWDGEQWKCWRAVEISTVDHTSIPQSDEKRTKQRKHQYADVKLEAYTLPIVGLRSSSSSWCHQTVQDGTGECNTMWTQCWSLVFQLLTSGNKPNHQVTGQLWRKVTPTYWQNPQNKLQTKLQTSITNSCIVITARVRTDVSTDSGPHLVHCRSSQCRSIFVDRHWPTLLVIAVGCTSPVTMAHYHVGGCST